MLPQIADLMEKMESQHQELLAAMAGLSEDDSQQHPNGEWSAKQQLAHLVQAEPTWMQWAQAIQENPGVAVGQTPEQGQIFLKDVDNADSEPLTLWLERLQQTRTDTLKLLQEIGLTGNQETLERKGTHRSFGEMNVLQFLRGIYRHDRMHMEQVLGREPSFVPRNAPGG